MRLAFDSAQRKPTKSECDGINYLRSEAYWVLGQRTSPYKCYLAYKLILERLTALR